MQTTFQTDTGLSLEFEYEFPIMCSHEDHSTNKNSHDNGPAVAYVVWEPCPCGAPVSEGFRCLRYVKIALERPGALICGVCGGVAGKVQRVVPI